MTEQAATGAEFRVPRRVLAREVDGEMVLLNLESEQYFGLDAVGAAIVSRLTAEPLESALDALSRDYEVSPEVLRADVDELVRELIEANLLERTRPSSA